MCDYLYIVWSHMPPYCMVQYIPQLPMQVYLCVSPISSASINALERHLAECSTTKVRGKAVSPRKSCQCLPKDDFSRCLCFPLHWCVTACVGVCMCVKLKYKCVKVGHSCQYKTIFSKRIFLVQWGEWNECINLVLPSSSQPRFQPHVLPHESKRNKQNQVWLLCPSLYLS